MPSLDLDVDALSDEELEAFDRALAEAECRAAARSLTHATLQGEAAQHVASVAHSPVPPAPAAACGTSARALLLHDIEDAPRVTAPGPVDFVRTRHGVLWVTDITSAEWCSLQLNLQTVSGQLKAETEAMKEGTAVHAAMEAEVVQRVEVVVVTKEDKRALKILNTILQLQQLVQEGRTREVELFARLRPEDPWLFGKLDEAVLVQHQGRAVVQLVELKTRRNPNMPREAQTRNACLQVLLYHRMYESLRTAGLETLSDFYLGRSSKASKGSGGKGNGSRAGSRRTSENGSRAGSRRTSENGSAAAAALEQKRAALAAAVPWPLGVSEPGAGQQQGQKEEAGPSGCPVAADSGPAAAEGAGAQGAAAVAATATTTWLDPDAPLSGEMQQQCSDALHDHPASAAWRAQLGAWRARQQRDRELLELRLQQEQARAARAALRQHRQAALLLALPWPLAAAKAPAVAAAAAPAPAAGASPLPVAAVPGSSAVPDSVPAAAAPPTDSSRSSSVATPSATPAASAAKGGAAAAQAQQPPPSSSEAPDSCPSPMVVDLSLSPSPGPPPPAQPTPAPPQPQVEAPKPYPSAPGPWTLALLIRHLHSAVLPALPPASPGSPDGPGHLVRYWYQGRRVVDKPAEGANGAAAEAGGSAAARGGGEASSGGAGTGRVEGAGSRRHGNWGGSRREGGGFLSPDVEVRHDEWSRWLDYTWGKLMEVLGGREEAQGVPEAEDWKCTYCPFRAPLGAPGAGGARVIGRGPPGVAAALAAALERAGAQQGQQGQQGGGEQAAAAGAHAGVGSKRQAPDGEPAAAAAAGAAAPQPGTGTTGEGQGGVAEVAAAAASPPVVYVCTWPTALGKQNAR